MCCDEAHGCGVSKRDWLKDAKYEGEEALSGESFYKWGLQRKQLITQWVVLPITTTLRKAKRESPGDWWTTPVTGHWTSS